MSLHLTPEALELVQMTLAYLKDPLTPKKTHFSTGEECDLFSIAAPIKQEIPSFSLPRQSFVAPKPKAQPPLLEPVAAPAPLKSTPENLAQAALKKTLQKLAPAMKFYETPLEDTHAKKIKQGYKEVLEEIEVVILLCDLSSDWVVFVKNLAKAIDERLGKVKVISAMNLEREKRWDIFLEKNRFRLFIASAQIDSFAGLKEYRKEKTLQDTPLLLLAPPATYQDKAQKALLWNQLCQLLK